MIGTVESIKERLGGLFHIFETVSVIIFSIEYVLRVWSCKTDPRFNRKVVGRIGYMMRPLMVFDLLSILPFFVPFAGLDFRSFRALRLIRLFRVARIGRFQACVELISDVVKSKREELIITFVMIGMLLIVASTLLYQCEKDVQPEVFSSIPASMWWAVITITSVGYGDVTPISVMGKVVAGIIAVLGVGLFSIPTGILGAGFLEAMQRRRAGGRVCPHCGEALSDQV